MNAIILAAGRGRRLRPYTDQRPKCMVELLGRPILHRQVCILRRNGIADITVVGGYRANVIDAPNVTMVFNPFYPQSNMVTSLFRAAQAMESSRDLLISYGDIVYEDRILSALTDSPGEVVVAADLDWQTLWRVRMEDPLEDAESFKMTKEARIVEVGRKLKRHTDAEAQFMGLVRVRADAVAAFKAAYRAMDRNVLHRGRKVEQIYMTDFIQHLVDIGWDVRAALVRNGWLEVDTANELERYNALARSGELDRLVRLS